MGLSKRYRIGERRSRTTLRETVSEWGRGIAGKLRSKGAEKERGGEIWALRGVSFSVERGTAVGVVGRNGAGKSTLLKLLSRITHPTEGRFRLRGRLASLLEVGTGFHPDLTGRENVLLNGAILGMRGKEIRKKLDAIVAFAEVERFVDTPVKHYSSGMYTRLAFAVAAHLEPEVLVVDEVLAVGDAAFQRKCLGRMREVTSQGRTVLFVSHNLAAVQALCSRALLLEGGRLVADGTASEVSARYAAEGMGPSWERRWGEGEERHLAGHAIVVMSASVVPPTGHAETVTVRTPLEVRIDFRVLRSGRYHVSLHFWSEQNLLLFNSFPSNVSAAGGERLVEGAYRSTCRIPGDLLNVGTIRVDLMVVRDGGTPILRDENALVFRVEDSPDLRNGWWGAWGGAVRPALGWETSPVVGDSARESPRT